MKRDAQSPQPDPRPYIGVRFRCCGVYARVYRNRNGTAFAGHCPKCAQPITIEISPAGSSDRFWEVG